MAAAESMASHPAQTPGSTTPLEGQPSSPQTEQPKKPFMYERSIHCFLGGVALTIADFEAAHPRIQLGQE